MKRVLVCLMLAALAVGSVACSREDAEDAAGEVAEEAQQAADEVADEARDAADRAEDVVNDRNVEMVGSKFQPETLRVKVGTEVTWINRDTAPHRIASENDVLRSENLEQGDEFSHRFTQAGDFPYYCSIHGKEQMSGQIVVST